MSDLRKALVAVWGTDFGVHDPTLLSRFTDMSRQPRRIETTACSWPAMRRTSIRSQWRPPR
jgi:hypothetical protein